METNCVSCDQYGSPHPYTSHILSSRVDLVCTGLCVFKQWYDSYSVSIAPHGTAVARERPWSFCQSAGGRLRLSMHTPWLGEVREGWLSCPVIVWEPVREMFLHATHHGTFSHSHCSLLSHCGLTVAWKVELVCTSWSPFHKKKKGKKMVGRDSVFKPSPKVLGSEEKAIIIRF